jgi:hypothetical protein
MLGNMVFDWPTSRLYGGSCLKYAISWSRVVYLLNYYTWDCYYFSLCVMKYFGTAKHHPWQCVLSFSQNLIGCLVAVHHSPRRTCTCGGAEVGAPNLAAIVWRENELVVAQKCTTKVVARRRFVVWRPQLWRGKLWQWTKHPQVSYPSSIYEYTVPSRLFVKVLSFLYPKKIFSHDFSLTLRSQ